MTELSTMGTIFSIIIIAFSLVCLGFFIALAIYFDRAKNFAESNPSAPISAGTAALMMWFSIIMTLFAAGLLIYGIVYIARQSSAAKKLKSYNISVTATPAVPTTTPDNDLRGVQCDSIVGNDKLKMNCVRVNNTTITNNPPASANTNNQQTLMGGEGASLGRIPRSSYYGY